MYIIKFSEKKTKVLQRSLDDLVKNIHNRKWGVEMKRHIKEHRQIYSGQWRHFQGSPN